MDVTAAEFKALFDSVRSWGRWGADDELGALNLLTADRVACGRASGAQRRRREPQPADEHGESRPTAQPGRVPHDPEQR